MSHTLALAGVNVAAPQSVLPLVTIAAVRATAGGASVTASASVSAEKSCHWCT
jgi:hypothetical protein